MRMIIQSRLIVFLDYECGQQLQEHQKCCRQSGRNDKSIRVYSEESARAKIFVEFVAMIVRCKMYIKLKGEMKKLDKKLNYMTVPAAIKELEKIEMVRQLDNIYRLDHAVTANQKVILKAFGLDANSIKYFASKLSKELKEAE